MSRCVIRFCVLIAVSMCLRDLSAGDRSTDVDQKANLKVVQIIQLDDSVYEIAMSPSGRTIVVVGGKSLPHRPGGSSYGKYYSIYTLEEGSNGYSLSTTVTMQEDCSFAVVSDDELLWHLVPAVRFNWRTGACVPLVLNATRETDVATRHVLLAWGYSVASDRLGNRIAIARPEITYILNASKFSDTRHIRRIGEPDETIIFTAGGERLICSTDSTVALYDTHSDGKCQVIMELEPVSPQIGMAVDFKSTCAVDADDYIVLVVADTSSAKGLWPVWSTEIWKVPQDGSMPTMQRYPYDEVNQYVLSNPRSVVPIRTADASENGVVADRFLFFRDEQMAFVDPTADRPQSFQVVSVEDYGLRIDAAGVPYLASASADGRRFVTANYFPLAESFYANSPDPGKGAIVIWDVETDSQ